MPAETEPIPRIARQTPVRWAFLALGCVSVTSGVIGHFVPIWPSTVFYLIALWCFKRSSPRLEAAILDHRIIGPPLRDWQEYRGIRAGTRRTALITLWVGLAVSAAIARRLEVYAILGAVAIGVTWYLFTRPTVPEPCPEGPRSAPDEPV
ncbi:MAG: YbaN family protein [Fimbriimonadaceae bacterium]|nr:YbaN family protein [Fimbriimonadaceae bacterium]